MQLAGNANHQLRTEFFVHRRIRSAVKKVEFISDLMAGHVARMEESRSAFKILTGKPT